MDYLTREDLLSVWIGADSCGLVQLGVDSDEERCVLRFGSTQEEGIFTKA